MFEKALKAVSVEVKEELMMDEREFLEKLWSEIQHELGVVQCSFDHFLERVEQEVESRKIDIQKFRNEKNEPVTNLFKRIVREIAKDSNIHLSNDSISRLLNYIRNQYSTGGILTGAVFPVRAFFERDEYGIPYKTGDENSCFRDGGCNFGSALWLRIEDEKYDRAKFVVFHWKDKASNKEGWGRCWVYRVSDWAIFATNFYSLNFDIKSRWLKYPLVRVLRLLAGLENVRFIYKDIYLPIYLNGDGLIIYEKSQFNDSDEVIDLSGEIQSSCMICKKNTSIDDLRIFEGKVYYDINGKVKGLIVCSSCKDTILDTVVCAGCGERYYGDDMHYHNGTAWCEDCYRERFEPCYICGVFDLREEMIQDRYGNWICSDCVNEHRRRCEVCGEYVYKEDVHLYEVLTNQLTFSWIEEKYICDMCAEDLRKMKCDICGYEFFYESESEIVRAGLCPVCYEERQRAFVSMSIEDVVKCAVKQKMFIYMK